MKLKLFIQLGFFLHSVRGGSMAGNCTSIPSKLKTLEEKTVSKDIVFPQDNYVSFNIKPTGNTTQMANIINIRKRSTILPGLNGFGPFVLDIGLTGILFFKIY